MSSLTWETGTSLKIWHLWYFLGGYMEEMFSVQRSLSFVVYLIATGSHSLLLKALNYFILTGELRTYSHYSQQSWSRSSLISLRGGALWFWARTHFLEGSELLHDQSLSTGDTLWNENKSPYWVYILRYKCVPSHMCTESHKMGLQTVKQNFFWPK